MQRQDDDTVHAAAIVLAAAARSTSTGLQRHQQQQLDDHDSCAAAKKTRWWSRLKAKLKWFRPHGHPQRIADASRSPEPGAPCAEQAAGSSSSYHYARHAPQPALAFVAPPSSPASSVLTSESPSPVVLLNASSSYSSPTASIFAIGPYAREPQQLVSPPAFSASAGLTEPSTAPVTPPPESSLHLLAAGHHAVVAGGPLRPLPLDFRRGRPAPARHRHSQRGPPPRLPAAAGEPRPRVPGIDLLVAATMEHTAAALGANAQ